MAVRSRIQQHICHLPYFGPRTLLFLRTRVVSSQVPISSLTFHRMFSSLLRTLFVFVCRVADFFVRFTRFLFCLLEVQRRQIYVKTFIQRLK